MENDGQMGIVKEDRVLGNIEVSKTGQVGTHAKRFSSSFDACRVAITVNEDGSTSLSFEGNGLCKMEDGDDKRSDVVLPSVNFQDDPKLDKASPR